MSEIKQLNNIYKYYRMGADARRQGKPSNVPPGVNKYQRRAYLNGYRLG